MTSLRFLSVLGALYALFPRTPVNRISLNFVSSETFGSCRQLRHNTIHSCRKKTDAKRRSNFNMHVYTCSQFVVLKRSHVSKVDEHGASVNLRYKWCCNRSKVVLYSSLVLLIEWQCGSITFECVCYRAKRRPATILFTRVANQPTMRADQFETRVSTHRLGLCTVLSTCDAIWPTQCIGRFATPVLIHEAVLSYCTVHACRKSTDAAGRSIWIRCVLPRSRFVYCTVHNCRKSTDAARW